MESPSAAAAGCSSGGTGTLPETFGVPNRFRKHMMIVADLETGNADAIEDAIIGAELQSYGC
jgi:hypothetical protein